MTSDVLEFILGHEPFSSIDPARFPESIPLDGILMNDARVRRFAKGELIVRQGDYGNSAFFIMSGTVRVLLDNVDEELLGRSVLKRKSLWEGFAQLWTNPSTPELRHYREDDKQARKTGVGQVVVDTEGARRFTFRTCRRLSARGTRRTFGRVISSGKSPQSRGRRELRRLWPTSAASCWIFVGRGFGTFVGTAAS